MGFFWADDASPYRVDFCRKCKGYIKTVDERKLQEGKELNLLMEDVSTAYKVQSCRFCADRVQNGLTPACDKACLTGAITSGPMDELLAKAKERVKVLGGKANVYGETQAGGLGVLYVLLDSPKVYGLPEAPKVAQASSLKTFTGPFGQVALVGSLMTVALNKLIQRKSQNQEA
ncbi:hypothetical protein HY792_01995 [Candidatus Desantisbacteria bacterium]|nr:hypothetical protein [Candidatus Desantisbacteria bacterium]